MKTKVLISELDFSEWLWSVIWIRKKDISGYDGMEEDLVDEHLNMRFNEESNEGDLLSEE